MQTLISKLQSRIDRASNEISCEEGYEHKDKYLLKIMREDQTLHKRLLGRLIELERNLSHAYGLLGDATEENIELSTRLRECGEANECAKI